MTIGRLRRVKVSHVRSVRAEPLRLDIADACTTLIGPNLAGKSSAVRALRAALDPSRPLDPDGDLPAGLDDPEPAVTLGFRGGPDLHAVWRDGLWQVPDHHPARGRVVWTVPRDGDAVDVIDRALRGATTATAGGRLPEGPARDRHLAVAIDTVVKAVLPDVAEVRLDLSAGLVQVIDLDGWPVGEDTGVRTAVALGTARALAEWGLAPVAVLVEEPGAFLHPAAQEALRDELASTAAMTGAAVVLTSTSPFVIPRGDHDRVVALARDDAGSTHIVAEAAGTAPQAALLGGLFRDRGMANVFDRVAALPPGTRGVVIVEGGTDKAYLEFAAEVLGRPEVLDGVVVIDAGGAAAVALEAVVLRAETDLPVLAILDNDQPGRQARDTLAKRLGFDRRREVTTFAEVVSDHPMGTEAEDLFDWRLVQRYVDQRGDRTIRGKRILRDDEWHFDLTSSAKSAFVGWVQRNARPEHMVRWGRLLDAVDERLGRAADVGGDPVDGVGGGTVAP